MQSLIKKIIIKLEACKKSNGSRLCHKEIHKNSHEIMFLKYLMLWSIYQFHIGNDSHMKPRALCHFAFKSEIIHIHSLSRQCIKFDKEFKFLGLVAPLAS